MVGGDVELLVVDAPPSSPVVVEDQRRAGMLEEARIAAAGLITAAVRREVAVSMASAPSCRPDCRGSG